MVVILLLLGRTLSSKLSDDKKSRIAQCQKSCNDLKQKLGARVTIDTNIDVKEIKGEAKVIKGDAKEIKGDAKEIKGDLKEIKGDIDRNSMCCIHDDVHSLRINHDAFRCPG